MIEELRRLQIVKDPKSKRLNLLLGMINIYPKNATFATQNKDEEVIIILRQHIVKNVSWVMTSLLLILIPFILIGLFYGFDHYINNDALLTPGAIAGIDQNYIIALLGFYYSFIVSYAFFGFIHWYFDLFIFTNERYISIDFNILKGRMITDIPLTDIIDISEKVYGFIPTIVGYGNIEFKTTSEKISIMNKVPQTIWIRDSLSDLIRYIRKIKVVKSKENQQADVSLIKSSHGGDVKIVIDESGEIQGGGAQSFNVQKEPKVAENNEPGDKHPGDTPHEDNPGVADFMGDVLAGKKKNQKIKTDKHEILEP
jgi:hypothetical protein